MTKELLEEWKQDLINNKELAAKGQLVTTTADGSCKYCALGRLCVVAALDFDYEFIRSAFSWYGKYDINDPVCMTYLANDGEMQESVWIRNVNSRVNPYDNVIKLINTRPELFLN
jgi:hypothetical protein